MLEADGLYEVFFIDADKNGHRCKLSEAAGLPFHEYLPVRKPAAYKKQRHLPGYYFFSTTGKHVLYEMAHVRAVSVRRCHVGES